MTKYYDKRIRLEKAIKAIEDGKISILDASKGTVEGSSNVTYEINIHDNTCRNGQTICKDLEYNCDPALGQVCYHILAVRMLLNPHQAQIV